MRTPDRRPEKTRWRGAGAPWPSRSDESVAGLGGRGGNEGNQRRELGSLEAASGPQSGAGAHPSRSNEEAPGKIQTQRAAPAAKTQRDCARLQYPQNTASPDAGTAPR